MVLAVRRGGSLRKVARRFHVALGTVQFWVHRAKGKRLDRVEFADRPAGPRAPANRTRRSVERMVLAARRRLKDQTALGEHGAMAIRQALLLRGVTPCPCVRTIGRILERRGAIDARRRTRRPPPVKGWFLPPVASCKAEVDSVDTVTDLVIKGGTQVTVLNCISLHGGLAQSWPECKITARIVVASLLAHWRHVGLPAYAKFDNDMIFQGAHQWPDSFGRVIRLCLQLGVAPVFAPPRETGFQAEIEAFNGRWQRMVWRRYHHPNLQSLQECSASFIQALRTRSAARIDAAPPRRKFPDNFAVDPNTPLAGRVIFIRRTDQNGDVACLGHRWKADRHWVHRCTRIEVDLTRGRVSIYALRRREPRQQTLLNSFAYEVQKKPFIE
jgi:transposase-like protein